ncbi:MAG: hypothetical protein OEU32_13205 [Acidimicrobiia bacterium]|nr:hypothetical protein [Acidimicrobiia bacterium]
MSVQVLGAVERAEKGLRGLRFESLRVRHYGDTARIEVPVAELPAVADCREAAVDVVSAAGYRHVTLDLEGFRSGNPNAALDGDVGHREV